MPSTSVRTLARLEREQFADFLEGLAPQQWSIRSLCPGWSVRDVAAHTVSYLDQSPTSLLLQMIRHRGNVDRLNATLLQRAADQSPEQWVRRMRLGATPSGAGALYGGRVALIECLIRQQDVRRPLGRSRVIPPDRLRVCLNFARISPVIGAARRTRGLRLIATDMDWSAGRGAAVRGTGEALLLAMTGRACVDADELAGPGVLRLCQQP